MDMMGFFDDQDGFFDDDVAAKIKVFVNLLREGDDDDDEQTAAAFALKNLALNDDANAVAIAEAGGIKALVDLLRDGSALFKMEAAGALSALSVLDENRVLLAEAGGLEALVELLRDGVMWAKEAAVRALCNLAGGNDANKVLIAEAGGIPPLLALLHDGSMLAREWAAFALQTLAHNNVDANAVAIAVAVGFDALVQLARGGRVTVAISGGDHESIVPNAGVPAKRKAALVVSKLLRDYVPGFESAPAVLKAAISSYL